MLSYKEIDGTSKPVAIIRSKVKIGAERNRTIVYLTRDDVPVKKGTVTFKSLILKKDDSHFEVIPDVIKSERTIGYFSGRSGSGKSFQMSLWTKNYKKLYPDSPVYMLSIKQPEEDPAFAGLGINFITLDEDFANSEVGINSFESNSLILFDDTDTISNNKINNQVVKLREQLLEVGRGRGQHMLISSHLFSNYKSTRTILNETHTLHLFKSGMSEKIRNNLKKELGIPFNITNEILKATNRGFVLCRNDPMYYLTEKQIKILDI